MNDRVYSKIAIIVVSVLLYFSFISTLFAHKGAEPFELKEWREVNHFSVFDDPKYSEISYKYIQKFHHDIYDQIELTLSHYPIVKHGTDHSEREYHNTRVWVRNIADPAKTTFVVAINYSVLHFYSFLIIEAEGPVLVDSLYVFGR